MCLPLCEWEYVLLLKHALILEMEWYLSSFLLSTLKLLETPGWIQDAGQMWIFHGWSLGIQPSQVVTPCWQPSPLQMAVAGTFPSQELTCPAKVLNPLLPCVLLPFLLNSAYCQVPVEETRGCLGRICVSHILILRALWQICSVRPYLKHTSYLRAHTQLHDSLFYLQDNYKWDRLLKCCTGVAFDKVTRRSLRQSNSLPSRTLF